MRLISSKSIVRESLAKQTLVLLHQLNFQIYSLVPESIIWLLTLTSLGMAAMCLVSHGTQSVYPRNIVPLTGQ
jgi:hypothetical protein